MRQYLRSQEVFNRVLKLLAFFAQKKIFDRFTFWATKKNASLNLRLNKPKPVNNVSDLAKSWKKMMPSDGQKFFKIKEITNETAYIEIHLDCPLRGTGNIDACHKLMNYDRSLMKSIGGELTVIESQSNSGKTYCSLEINKKRK